MHNLMHNINDHYLWNGRKLIRPGDRDPDWLLRAADHERILKAMADDARRESPQATTGIVARVRVALGRA